MSATVNDISFLIATMHRDSLRFLDAMFPHHDWRDLNLVIVNQSKTKQLHSPYSNHCIVNSTEFGLSKSRNLALEYCKTSFGLIADDDVIYTENCVEIIYQALQDFKNFALYTFQSLDQDLSLRKDYLPCSQQLQSHRINYKVTSFEMLVNVSQLKSSKLSFNEHFGLGANFPSGEEEIFLAKLLKLDLKWCYIAQPIVIHPGLSTGQKQHELTYITTKAVIKYLEYDNIVYLWLLKFMFFLIRKQHLKSNKLLKTYCSCIQAIQKFKAME